MKVKMKFDQFLILHFLEGYGGKISIKKWEEYELAEEEVQQEDYDWWKNWFTRMVKEYRKECQCDPTPDYIRFAAEVAYQWKLGKNIGGLL